MLRQRSKHVMTYTQCVKMEEPWNVSEWINETQRLKEEEKSLIKKEKL